MKKSELFLEDSIVDDFSREFDSLEMPLSKQAFSLVILFIFFISVIVLARIFILGVKNGDFYKNRALANMSETTFTPAERGLIFDRFGKPLVKNSSSFRAVLKLPNFLKNSEENKKIGLGQLASFLNLQSEQIEEWIGNVNLERQNSIVLSRDLSIEQVAQVKNLDLDYAVVDRDFSRQYDKSGVYSHILGYVGAASGEDLKSNQKLLINDLIGKSGLELFYDNELRGENGEEVEYLNSRSESFDEKISISQTKGDNLYLTIDADLQEFFYSRLKSQLDSLNRVGGVGIAMDPQTGEILSLVSLPSFDNNKITSNLLVDPSKPLFNRAVNGLYSPGSTIKPLVAVAALAEKVIDPFKEIFSPGYLDIPNPYNPDKPSRFLDWRPQGWVNMYSALARSSNVYFYEVGGGFGEIKGLGIEKLRNYWKKFGLDQKTGIDLPGEKAGFLPDVEEKEKRTGIPWRLGDTYNISIGQGDLMITPLELINYISSIAAKGVAYRPFLVKKIADEKGNILKETPPEIIIDNSSLADFIKEAEKGMIDVSKKPYGTAYMLNGLPFTVASKTGSAQIENNAKVNAFYVGYNLTQINADKTQISADNNICKNSNDNNCEAAPQQIAVLILVENAREGSLNAVPVGNDVFKWYYENRLITNDQRLTTND